MTRIKLTHYTEAGGCGCKISPKVLSDIVDTIRQKSDSQKLLVGNCDNDDAAVYRVARDKAVVFTDDFFSPIVDDPFFFGKIAASNALSDIYAMGASPKVALSILGWPVEVLSFRSARRVLEGAKSVCEDAGVLLAGGHSINNPQPIFGLSVIGEINPKYLKLNSTAKKNDIVYLTKPLGSGIYSTALKSGKISKSDKREMLNLICSLNNIGIKIAKLKYVNAMTDVTGFGFLGHLIELCKGGNLCVEVKFENIRVLANFDKYFEKGIITSGGKRNWESYKKYVNRTDYYKRVLLSDPQTNGGLLISVCEKNKSDFEFFLKQNNLIEFSKPIGVFRVNKTNSKQVVVIK